MIELVEIQTKHRETLAKLLNDESMSRWLLTVPYPYGLQDADSFISVCTEGKDSTDNRRYAIEADGEHVGGIGIHRREQHSGEVGYWVGKQYSNKGIATAALKQILDIGFGEMGLIRIYAITFAGNDASERVLVKCGFEYEGLMRKARVKDGVPVDCKIFAVVK
ncbi:MAG: GNAT family N-acetyltransferase [Ignavibacteria bacterium]|nr:GNAT family N-acetyltransferase [Ignavibacteria bacterium]